VYVYENLAIVRPIVGTDVHERHAVHRQVLEDERVLKFGFIAVFDESLKR
jgi:hypothetical protein